MPCKLFSVPNSWQISVPPGGKGIPAAAGVAPGEGGGRGGSGFLLSPDSTPLSCCTSYHGLPPTSFQAASVKKPGKAVGEQHGALSRVGPPLWLGAVSGGSGKGTTRTLSAPMDLPSRLVAAWALSFLAGKPAVLCA